MGFKSILKGCILIEFLQNEDINITEVSHVDTSQTREHFTIIINFENYENKELLYSDVSSRDDDFKTLQKAYKEIKLGIKETDETELCEGAKLWND